MLGSAISNQINVVYGNEWNAGNLSYHLKSRPIWDGFVEREKLDQLKDYMCLMKCLCWFKIAMKKL